MIHHFQVPFDHLHLSATHLEEFMGYEAGTSLESFGELYQHALEHAREICDLKGEYRIIDHAYFQSHDKSLHIDGRVFRPGKIIYSQLKHLTGVVLFLCTAGKEISRLSKELMGGQDQMLGYVFDVIGSVSVEMALDVMHEKIEETMAEKGLGTTNRFSPGYCSWDVAEQQTLFSFFPDNYCNITLSPSSLMNPAKSVSGIIGTGPGLTPKKHPCELCTFKDCFRNRSI